VAHLAAVEAVCCCIEALHHQVLTNLHKDTNRTC
jgi:hypothetical protein